MLKNKRRAEPTLAETTLLAAITTSTKIRVLARLVIWLMLVAGASAIGLTGNTARGQSSYVSLEEIEQACDGEMSAYIKAQVDQDRAVGSHLSSPQNYRRWAEGSVEYVWKMIHTPEWADLLSHILHKFPPPSPEESAKNNVYICAYRAIDGRLTGHEYPGANSSVASAPPANIAPPRPNPPVAAAPVPSVPGLNPAVTPLVARMVRQAYDYAPPGWSAPPYRLPRRGGNVWMDQYDAEHVQYAAKGAWIEQRLTANCQKELATAASLLSDKFSNAKFDTEVSLAGAWNGYKNTPAEYAAYLQPQLQENSPSDDYHKVAAYQICLLKQRAKELDASLVAPAYQPLNDQMAEAFQRQQQGRTEKLHNHANDATSCLSVVATGTKVEWGTSGKFKLVNTCGYPVSASWCANTRYCETGLGNLWTIGAGRDYPIFFADPANPDIRVGACRVGAQATNKVDVVANNNGVSMVDTAHDPPQPAPGVSIMQGHKCD